jgi:hypothetical protein
LRNAPSLSPSCFRMRSITSPSLSLSMVAPNRVIPRARGVHLGEVRARPPHEQANDVAKGRAELR